MAGPCFGGVRLVYSLVLCEDTTNRQPPGGPSGGGPPPLGFLGQAPQATTSGGVELATCPLCMWLSSSRLHFPVSFAVNLTMWLGSANRVWIKKWYRPFLGWIIKRTGLPFPFPSSHGWSRPLGTQHGGLCEGWQRCPGCGSLNHHVRETWTCISLKSMYFEVYLLHQLILHPHFLHVANGLITHPNPIVIYSHVQSQSV